MPSPGKKTLSAAAIALAASLGTLAVGHILKAEAEVISSVSGLFVSVAPGQPVSVEAYVDVTVAGGGRSSSRFVVPVTAEIDDAARSLRDAAQAAFEARVTAPKE